MTNGEDGVWSGAVEQETIGAISVLTLRNGERNLLNPAILTDIRTRLQECDDNPDIRAVLLTGAGETFCGGLDIAPIKAGADPAPFGRALMETLRIFPRLGLPVAAAVNGDALAGGASFVAACDFAVAVDTARIGTMEVSAGMWPMIAQVPIIHRLGPRLAMENIGSGEPFTAERAREVGLVQAVVEAGRAAAVAREWLDKALRAAGAGAPGRRSVYELASMSYDDAFDAALPRFTGLFGH
ncbi:enoyl-CoA hydratase/isomerase family protein [Streptomyces sp. NPDC002574]|uniref:enoyl-CoA hydratase/isomerase family protein n=1 Tax=Streptomyces sp. NPDC002574 TaxID=3364652 RepID=UPI0036C00F86